MRTITERYDVYTFDELNEEAKQRAIEDYCVEGLHYEWWDYIYEDAIQIGKLMGIEIDNIFFSGFSRQGDGACFEGSYYYEKGSVKAIKDYAPKDKELHRIALELSKAQRPHFYQIYATVKQSGHYMHEMCTDISVYGEDQFFVDVDTDDQFSELLRDFMRLIYKQLELEYDYLTSEESIRETSISNEWEYTEDGKLI